MTRLSEINKTDSDVKPKQFKRWAAWTVVVLAFLGETNSARASTYDALSAFSSSNPNGTWSYGQGVTGASFAPFTVYSSNNCVTVPGLACWEPPVTVLYSPDVSYNTTDSAFWGTTFLVPSNALRIHPAESADVIVQWTAPASGIYSIKGFFELLDGSPTGITGEVYDGTKQLYSEALTGPAASEPTLTPGGSESFALVKTLAKGEVLSFGVNNKGNFLGDSTGFNADIISEPPPEVPEPESLALAGLGVVFVGCYGRLQKVRL